MSDGSPYSSCPILLACTVEDLDYLVFLWGEGTCSPRGLEMSDGSPYSSCPISLARLKTADLAEPRSAPLASVPATPRFPLH